MKTRYKLLLETTTILKRVISSETPSTVWIEKDPKRKQAIYSERKKTTAYTYFDTFEEAKAAGLQLLLERRADLELQYTALNNLKEDEI